MATKSKRPRRAYTAYGTLSNDRIRKLLDKDSRNGCIVTSRNDQISRAHYALLLGCTRGSLSRFNAVFTEYEQKLGIKSGLRLTLHLNPAVTDLFVFKYDDIEVRDYQADPNIRAPVAV